MKITNTQNLPEVLVKAVQNDRYEGGTASDYTTTSLIKPARIRALQAQHDDLEEDVSERLWALLGKVVHKIIEEAATDEIVEQRLFATVAGKTVSGRFDLYYGKELWDWKLTSIYAGKDGAKQEWIEQGNINRFLCAENGIEIDAINFAAIYRDWSKMAVERKKDDYPQQQIQVFRIPLWPMEKTRVFIEERISVHEAAKTKLPLCTDEEMWRKPEKFALMQKGRKRAVKLYDTEAQAKAAVGNSPDPSKHFVEHRASEPTRCLFYCSVSAYCTQFREMMEAA